MKEGQMYVIAITGGIGSGKSVVSRIVEAMGYPVYDCDSRAKILMDESDVIKCSISEEIDRICIREGMIDRKVLSTIVFSDEEKLSRLNSIVHGAVRDDLSLWIAGCRDGGNRICFVETAILYQSGLDRMAEEVWTIKAPLDMRVERVMKRNGLSRDEVMKRITSQDSFIPESVHTYVNIIINDGDNPVLTRVEQLIKNSLSFL